MREFAEGVTSTIDAGGRPAIRLEGPGGRALVSLVGAQILSWHAAGRDVLWTAGAPSHEPGKPVRGGVPVVFPWFSDHPNDPGMPAHGFARGLDWRCTSTGPGPRAVFSARDDDRTRAMWPHAFTIELAVGLGAGLDVALTVANTGERPFRFEEALHTYFAVGDVASASVHGLEGVPFVEHAREPEASWDPMQPLRFRAETDRVFQDVPGIVELRAERLRRTVRLRTVDARSAIVWNPWPAKAARLSQMLPDDWRGFCCIESANVKERAIGLQPGERHVMRLSLEAEDW